MGAGASCEADELLAAARRGDVDPIVRALTKPDGRVALPPVRGGVFAHLLSRREGLLHVAARHGQSEGALWGLARQRCGRAGCTRPVRARAAARGLVMVMKAGKGDSTHR